MEHSELRIVSDELFAQAQEQFARATRGFGVKRLGGLSRTEASRKYLSMAASSTGCSRSRFTNANLVNAAG